MAHKIRKGTFPVLEMGCAACAAKVEKILKNQKGVSNASVNFAGATVTIEYDASETSPERLQEALQNAGYDLEINEEEDSEEEPEPSKRLRRLRYRAIGALIFSVPVFIFSMFLMDMPFANEISCLLSAPVVFWFGREFYGNAWKQLKHGSASMDTLVALSTGIAYFFSLFNLLFPEFWLSRGVHPHVYFEAASVIIAFILLGRLLEEKAKGKTSSAIKKLIGLQPKTVIREDAQGIQTEIQVRQVSPGDILIARPGERIAADGIVIGGSSYVDESMLTGEPIPVSKELGANVFAGSINQKGNFRFQAGKVGQDTLLAQMICMVQDAQGSKAPVQKLVDRIASVFVPVVISISILSFILWLLLDPVNGFTHGILASVTVLIIACPCALGLATPTAIMVGIGKGAENGILIKDAESLETAKKVNAVVLDKTGTITEGKPVVNEIHWLDDSDKSLFYSLEKLSEHPLAEAVVQHLSACETLPVDGFESITGKGVKGFIDGDYRYAGNRKLMEENNIVLSPELIRKADKWTAESKAVIWFANSKEAKAAVAVSDKIKDSSARAIQQLYHAGIEVYMLTGDSEAPAREVASQAGIKQYKAEVFPDEKANFIKNLQQKGKTVAMVGDGINDSAALAQADLSIAMGKGSDIAMDVAHMTIISSDLTKIVEAIRLSDLSVKTIRWNLFWAFVYNIIGIPLAAGVLFPVNGFLLNPMIAGAAMALSSVCVVSNSLALNFRRFHR